VLHILVARAKMCLGSESPEMSRAELAGRASRKMNNSNCPALRRRIWNLATPDIKGLFIIKFFGIKDLFHIECSTFDICITRVDIVDAKKPSM
jgi:hypothetical protein